MGGAFKKGQRKAWYFILRGDLGNFFSFIFYNFGLRLFSHTGRKGCFKAYKKRGWTRGVVGDNNIFCTFP